MRRSNMYVLAAALTITERTKSLDVPVIGNNQYTSVILDDLKDIPVSKANIEEVRKLDKKSYSGNECRHTGNCRKHLSLEDKKKRRKAQRKSRKNSR